MGGRQGGLRRTPWSALRNQTHSCHLPRWGSLWKGRIEGSRIRSSVLGVHRCARASKRGQADSLIGTNLGSSGGVQAGAREAGLSTIKPGDQDAKKWSREREPGLWAPPGSRQGQTEERALPPTCLHTGPSPALRREARSLPYLGRWTKPV